MQPFHFQQFSVKQTQEVFRVGTDALLLGALVTPREGTILEVGTGTGIVSLMLAQRIHNAEITAIDIQRESVELAAQNFAESLFADRLTAKQADFKVYNSESKFDLIVSNPPYFAKNNSVKDVMARQTVALDFNILVARSAELLNEQGCFSVIIPNVECEHFISLAGKCGLKLRRQVNIYGIAGGVVRRVILEFAKQAGPVTQEVFTIEKSPRQYSDQYLELTREFHVFSKK